VSAFNQNVMKTLNLLTKIFVLFFSANSFAQGLEGIIVEKYYIPNAADVANATSNGAVTPLTTNSVVYRVYVDMAAGYKFSQLYGNASHNLTVNTTTAFYNDPSYGVSVNPGTISLTNLMKNTTLIDSYFTTGGAGGGKAGVMKTEDTDGSVGNTQSILANNPGGCYGLPITGSGSQDGLLPSSASTYVVPNSLGLPTSINVLDQTNGGAIVITNGSIAALGGVVGPTSSNKVLIGQFTTNGVFTFALNVQIVNISTGLAENYVASNPTGSELTHASLTLAANTPPTISLTASPSTSGVITNTSMTLTATAADVNGGTVTGVEFFVDGVSIGTGTLASGNSTSGTYTKTYVASVNGSHVITAKATDNDCASTTTSNYNITVAANQAPVVSNLTAPATAYLSSTVNFTCTATDQDGTVASVEFFVNGVSIGTDNTSPYSFSYTTSSSVSGSYSVQAKATDNLGLVGAFASTTMSVMANTPPTCVLTNPTSSQLITAPTVVTLQATASDNDGVAGVDFYVNGTLVGSDATSPYSFDWTSTPGIKTFYAKATDTYGAYTNSTNVTIDIADPNALPYKIKNNTQYCDVSTYCMPVAVAQTYTVDNVIGYDVILNYDASKLTPTGNVTVNNGLINPNYVETAVSINAPSGSNGSMQISLYLNSNAPSTAEFNGTNTDIFCVQFAKTAGFNPLDSAALSISSIQESYYTGVILKTANAGKAYSIKNTTYEGNLEFWSDNQAIKYNTASPSSYLITNVYGSMSTTGTATSGATAVTIPNSVTGVVAGMKVVANGVPAGTTVASISGNTVTLSAATTAALSSTAMTFVSATAVQPNLTGNFTHSLLNGQDVRIERDIANINSVQLLVNAADAVLAKTLLLNGNFTPSVYQIMALDVNLDGVVSAGDISQIKQRATLTIPEFRQAWNYNAAGVSNGQPSKDWVFVDKTRVTSDAAYQISATFPANDGTGYSKSHVPVAPFNLAANVTNYSTCPIVETETYKGIMLGDVNASYATFTANGILKSDNGAVVLDLASAVKEGTTFRIPVSFESTEATNALDFAVRFNENNVSFTELNNVAVGMEANAFMNETDRTFRFTGFDVANFTVGATVAELVLQSNNETISAKDIIADLALLNGKPVDVKFEKSSEAIQSVFNVSIYPNPSNGAFSVQATENATVDVYDMNGKQIIASQVISSNGKVNIDLNNVEAGVYLVRVQNDAFSTTKRIVIEK
jgi:hypothetical protein